MWTDVSAHRTRGGPRLCFPPPPTGLGQAACGGTWADLGRGCSWNTPVSPALFIHRGSQRPGPLVQCSVRVLSLDPVNWKHVLCLKKEQQKEKLLGTGHREGRAGSRDQLYFTGKEKPLPDLWRELCVPSEEVLITYYSLLRRHICSVYERKQTFFLTVRFMGEDCSHTHTYFLGQPQALCKPSLDGADLGYGALLRALC